MSHGVKWQRTLCSSCWKNTSLLVLDGVADLGSSGSVVDSLDSDSTRLSLLSSSSSLGSTVTPLGSFVAPSPLGFTGSGSRSTGLGSISSSSSSSSSSSNSTAAPSGFYLDHPPGTNNPNHPSSSSNSSSSGGPGSGISMSSSMSGSFPIPGSGRSTSVSGFDVPDVPVRPTVLDTPRLRDRSNDDFLNTANGHDPSIFPDKTIIKHMVDTASFIISDFSKQYMDNVSSLSKARSAHKILST